MTDEKLDPNDDTANHYKTHNSRPACDECAKEQKRLAAISAGLGVLLGAGAVFFYWKSLR